MKVKVCEKKRCTLLCRAFIKRGVGYGFHPCVFRAQTPLIGQGTLRGQSGGEGRAAAVSLVDFPPVSPHRFSMFRDYHVSYSLFIVGFEVAPLRLVV